MRKRAALPLDPGVERGHFVTRSELGEAIWS